MYKPTYLCTMYLGWKRSSPRKSCNFICCHSVAAVVLGLQALFLLFLLRVSSHSCETLQELLPTLLGGGAHERAFCGGEGRGLLCAAVLSTRVCTISQC